MKMQCDRCVRCTGFTLIEVIVALSLLSVIMLGLITALVTFANTGSRLERRALESDDVRLIHGFLRQSLGAASPRSHVREDDMVQTVWFDGAEDRLEWLGALPARHGLGGLHHMLLERDDGSEGDILILSYLPYVGDDQPPDWSNAPRHVLFDGVTRFVFAYRRLDSEYWAAQWDDPFVLPGHVRLDIDVDGASWPELVVHVLAAEAGSDVNLVGQQ